MARVKGILKNFQGKLDNCISIRKRTNGSSTYPAHIEQPRRLSRRQLAMRERQSHNNVLWRALKETKQVYIEGGKDAYHRFMALNTECPIPYIPKLQCHSGNALLLPNMVLSEGPVKTINYQFDEVDGRPALLTDLTKTEAKKGTLLLYVLQQQIHSYNGWPDDFRLKIKVETITPDMFTVVPSTLLTLRQSTNGCLALVDDRFADPMLGFGLVHIINGHVSTQHVITRCTYYERYTTEEALQAAAKSYKGLTGEE